MKDKEILDLYLGKSNDAIPQTAQKYGDICAYITSHILENEEEAAVCVKECYEILWESIPPHRPQNLKAYLCKITRNHALHMRYPKMNEQKADLFHAEIIIQDFLKGLEPEQRKLLIARYWYFSSVAEISAQYKMSENKVNAILNSLRQKLDDALREKKVLLQSEEELFYAMTEVEDFYLEEAEPKKVPSMKADVLGVGTEEKHEVAKVDIKNLLKQILQKYRVPAIACSVLLVLVFVVLIWPKNPVEQNPTEQSPTESGKPNTEIVDTDEDDTSILLEDLISIVGVGTFHKADLEQLKTQHPWSEDKEIAALPVYKNLSDYYSDRENFTEYMTEDSLNATVEKIATKLNMNIISTKFDRARIGGTENTYAVVGVQVTTDTGSIQINARGKVTVSFTEGVQLPMEYDMSDTTPIEHANNLVVAYLMDKYEDIIEAPYFGAHSYPTYDTEGNRTMHFQAIVDSGGLSNVKNLLDYNFNQVEFYYNEGMGLTGFCYGDIRMATELLGYYPIISLEEAKALLQEGNFRSGYFDFESGGLSYEEEDILGVELMYITEEWEKEYQPYYCFYIMTAVDNTYGKCYVPAVEGVRVDGGESEGEEVELPEAEVEIIDLSEYECLDGMLYYKDGKPYTLKNGAIVEAKDYDGSEDYNFPYGEVSGEYAEDGKIEWKLYYKGEEIVNLTRLPFPPGSGNDSLDAKYIEGQVIVFDIRYTDSDTMKPIATVYVYSKEEQSLTPYMFSVPLYSKEQPQGLRLSGGRYPTMGNDKGEIVIVDLLTGENVNTGISYEKIDYIWSACEEYYAVAYKTGEIALVSKARGEVVKQTKYQLNFIPDGIVYQDDMLYIQADYGNQVFVIKEFE